MRRTDVQQKILLRALILEDRPEDAELMAHELRRSGYDPQWQRVETEPDFLAHLNPPPDVILADYSMPELEAGRALQLLQERGLNIPFIVVSGTIGEDAAVTGESGNELWELWLSAAKTSYIVSQCIATTEPAYLAKHAFQLAQLFNAFYHRYPILSEPDEGRRTFLLAKIGRAS